MKTTKNYLLQHLPSQIILEDNICKLHINSQQYNIIKISYIEYNGKFNLNGSQFHKYYKIITQEEFNDNAINKNIICYVTSIDDIVSDVNDIICNIKYEIS